MEAAGEGAQQALVEKASIKQDGSSKHKQPSAEDKVATAGSEEEEPEPKEKKARKGDDEKAPALEAGKGDEKIIPASAEEKGAGKGDDKAPLASAEKEGVEDKAPPASAEKEAAVKEGDDDKAPASAEEEEVVKERDDDKPPASADKAEAWKEGDGDRPPASAEKEASSGKEKARKEGDDEKTALASAEKEAAKGDEDNAPEFDDQANPADAVPVALANPADAVAPHIPLDTLVFDIFSRLPSKSSVRCALLSKACEQRLRENGVFNAHLLPRCRSVIGDEAPNLLVLKPTGRGSLAGYSHLTVMRLASKVVFDMPIRTETEDYRLYHNPNLPKPMVAEFFNTTVTELDLSIMAGEGRVLLGHSGKHGRFFICNPTQERVIKLPAPLLDIDTGRTIAAIQYALGSSGGMEFSVVLLSVLPGPTPHSYAVHCFTSAREGPGPRWVVRQWEDEEVHTVLTGVSAPGVYGRETASFYWINSKTGVIIGYDPKEHRISLVPPPPLTEAHPICQGWSLGSTAGQLRLSCFPVGREAEDRAYLQIDVSSLLSIWVRNDDMWNSVKQISVPVVWMLSLYRRTELPIDAAQAESHFILVRKDQNLLLRSLEAEDMDTVVSNLYVNKDPYLDRMYQSFNAFFIYL